MTLHMNTSLRKDASSELTLSTYDERVERCVYLIVTQSSPYIVEDVWSELVKESVEIRKRWFNDDHVGESVSRCLS